MEILLGLSHTDLEAWVSYYLGTKIEGDRPTLVYTLCRRLGVPLPNEMSGVDWLTCTGLSRVDGEGGTSVDRGVESGIGATAAMPTENASLHQPIPLPFSLI